MIKCNIIYKKDYLKGVRKLEREHKFKLLLELDELVGRLSRKEIASAHHNHPLTGIYKGFYDLHLSDGDTVLIYKYEGGSLVIDLILQNLGPHDEVFPNTKSGRKAIKRSLKEELIIREGHQPITLN